MKFEKCKCAHNLISDFSEAYLNEPEVQVFVEQPFPISKPFKVTGEDIIQKYHEDKKAYFNQLLTLRKDFRLVKDRIMSQSFEDSHVAITKGLSNFCNRERFEAPFGCDYNPFYGLSSLEYFILHNRNYLVRPDSENNLCICNVAKPWKNHKLILNQHEQITKICSKTQQSDVLLLLQLQRELNLIIISNIDETGNIKFQKKFKKSVIDSALDQSRLGVILFDTKFRLYDVETNKKLNLKGHSVDSAIKFEFLDHNNIGLLTENSLKIIDQRCKDHRLFKPELAECNRLSSSKIDVNEVYLGSRHHLIWTDLRFFKNVEFCTHLMKTSPCYIDCVDNYSKILCFSSQKCDEKALFTGNPIGSIPLNVPSISDTLLQCQLKNDVMLLDHLEKRLQSSTRGLKLVGDNDSVDLYTANYFGDIFKQQISTTRRQSGVDSIKSLYKWAQKLPESPKILNLTDVVDMSTARFALNKETMKEDLTKFTKKSQKATLFLNQYSSLYNKWNVSSLAANFVAIWDDEEEREEVDLVPQVAPIDKVSSWIESSYFFE